MGFLQCLVFSDAPQEELSLLDLKSDLNLNANCDISQEAIHKKFTPNAVNFLKQVFSDLLLKHFQQQGDFTKNSKCFFTSINIKDSSKFSLPTEFAKVFPGYGGYKHGKSSLLNIQYEYDLLSGNWKSLEITSALRNDQQDSKETVGQIQEGSLNLRDLGYVTTTYLQAIEKQGAFYLNRLPKIGVYIKKQGKFEKLDWKKLDKEIKQNNLRYRDLEVYLGSKEKIGSRMIISPAPDNVKNERIRKSEQGGKRTNGYNISSEHKLKAGYNIFITNVPSEILSAEQVIQTYRLRWQIELVFKAWKSNLKVDKMKYVKLERMLCQLYAKFIWILLGSNLINIANHILGEHKPDKTCSPLKFFKTLKKLSQEIRALIQTPLIITQWLKERVILLIPSMVVEKRIKQPTHGQLIYHIFLS